MAESKKKIKNVLTFFLDSGFFLLYPEIRVSTAGTLAKSQALQTLQRRNGKVREMFKVEIT